MKKGHSPTLGRAVGQLGGPRGSLRLGRTCEGRPRRAPCGLLRLPRVSLSMSLGPTRVPARTFDADSERSRFRAQGPHGPRGCGAWAVALPRAPPLSAALRSPSVTCPGPSQQGSLLPTWLLVGKPSPEVYKTNELPRHLGQTLHVNKLSCQNNDSWVRSSVPAFNEPIVSPNRHLVVGLPSARH